MRIDFNINLLIIFLRVLMSITNSTIDEIDKLVI